MYSIKEAYYTIQGEGYHTGRPAVFLRFSGCNLWSGLEKDRASAKCKFCDTDFWGTDGVNGGKYIAEDLASFCKSLWPDEAEDPFIVCTGGEPLLQLDPTLIAALHNQGFYIAIETNGTLRVPDGVDWVCVSPKADQEIIVMKGQELKLVYPQLENSPEDFINFSFDHFFLQPLDDEDQEKHIQSCIQYCHAHPKWHLSLQTHKFIGIP